MIFHFGVCPQEDDDDDGDDDDEPPIPPPTAGAQWQQTGAVKKHLQNRSLLKSSVQHWKWIGGLFFLHLDFWKSTLFLQELVRIWAWIGWWAVGMFWISRPMIFSLCWGDWNASSDWEALCELAGHVSQHSLGASTKQREMILTVVHVFMLLSSTV